jgi:hypothetical protein
MPVAGVTDYRLRQIAIGFKVPACGLWLLGCVKIAVQLFHPEKS